MTVSANLTMPIDSLQPTHPQEARPLPRFDAPGPGPWEAEGAHFPRPITQFAAEAFMRGFPRGFAEGAADYGLLLSHFKPALVNGFLYQQPVAFGSPEGAMGPPPKPILWLLTRLHPRLRARIAVCREAFASQLWRRDLERWDTLDRPAAERAHRAFQAVEPSLLSDAELLEHLRQIRDHVEAMVCLHHRYTISATIATGDYLVHTCAWTGCSSGEALSLLRGSSPISNGVAASELSALARAVQATAAAQSVLEGKDAARVLSELSALPDPVATTLQAYLDVVRYRSIGYDLCDKLCGEMPELLVRAIRAATDSNGAERAAVEQAEKQRALEARVPGEQRAAFDLLLVEARWMNRLRDERGVYSDGWGTGLARRAVLEAGRRLVERQRLADAEHAVDVRLEEITALFGGGAAPSLEAVTERVRWRQTKTVADIPPFLNAPPAGPPSPE
ncbi:MAG TPA: hypothetical protein VJU61_21725, partial [Polyangiaceae bacterium]|nr:hypothetical protein [Polyangiaceae bacterium]